jgi:hypothetical protein
MPVSKKRKKEGKPVQRQAPAGEQQTAVEHPEGSHPGHSQMKAGRPKNPFVAQQPQVRSSQRGR